MRQDLISEIEEFAAETGLSSHRVGIILAKNGKLIDRLRAGGRVWPETEEAIRQSIRRERANRSPQTAEGAEP